MQVWGAVALVLALGLGPAAAGCEPGEAVILLHHSDPSGDAPRSETLADFAQRADLALQGRACVEIQAGTMAEEPRLLAALIAGRVQLGILPISRFADLAPRVQVYDLPFLFPDLAAVDAFQAGPAGQAILADIERAGLRGLGHWHNGMAQLAAPRPLLAPTDAAGLTFAANGAPMLARHFAALGAKAQALGQSETRAALASGQLDGQAATWTDLARDQGRARATQVTETNHAVLGDLLVASTAWWVRLDTPTRAILTRLAVEAAHDHNRLSLERDDQARAHWLRNGGVVLPLTPAQRAAWVAAMAPVWRSFEARIGAPVIAAALEASTP